MYKKLLFSHWLPSCPSPPPPGKWIKNCWQALFRHRMYIYMIGDCYQTVLAMTSYTDLLGVVAHQVAAPALSAVHRGTTFCNTPLKLQVWKHWSCRSESKQAFTGIHYHLGCLVDVIMLHEQSHFPHCFCCLSSQTYIHLVLQAQTEREGERERKRGEQERRARERETERERERVCVCVCVPSFLHI